MPCLTLSDEAHLVRHAQTEDELRSRIAFLESALCATMRALDVTASKQKDMVKIIGPSDDGVVNYPFINYEQAGITKEQLREWWNAHRQRDARKG